MGIIKMPQWLQEFYRQSEGFCGGEATLTDIVYNCQCMMTVKPVWLKSNSEGKQLSLSCHCHVRVKVDKLYSYFPKIYFFCLDL